MSGEEKREGAQMPQLELDYGALLKVILAQFLANRHRAMLFRMRLKGQWSRGVR